jgi:hypothetical protein
MVPIHPVVLEKKFVLHISHRVYGKEMADIIANNIFHKKGTVQAC